MQVPVATGPTTAATPSPAARAALPEEPLTSPLVVVVGEELRAVWGALPGPLADLEVPAGTHVVELLPQGTLLVQEGAFRHPGTLDGRGRSERLADFPTTEVAAAPDGRTVALLDAVGRPWLVEPGWSGSLRRLSDEHFSRLHWSPDSRYLGLQQRDGYRVFDSVTGRTVASGPGRLLAVGPDMVVTWDGERLTLLGNDGMILRRWESVAPSTSAAVPGGLLDPSLEHLALPASVERAEPGLTVLSLADGRIRTLSRGELHHPSFAWSGDGSHLYWIEEGGLFGWRGPLPGTVERVGLAAPGTEGRLQVYDPAASDE